MIITIIVATRHAVAISGLDFHCRIRVIPRPFHERAFACTVGEDLLVGTDARNYDEHVGTLV